MGLISTERVSVRMPAVERDELGEPVSRSVAEAEVDAVVCPGATSDLGAERPAGARVAYTVHFPKTWSAPLKGATLVVRGEELAVVGDPRPLTPANTPGDFNMAVEAAVVDG